MVITRERLGIGAREMQAFLASRDVIMADQITGLFPPVVDWKDFPQDGVRRVRICVESQKDLVVRGSLQSEEVREGGIRSVNQHYQLACTQKSTNIDLNLIDIRVTHPSKNYAVYSPHIIIPSGVDLLSYTTCREGFVSKALPPTCDGSLDLVIDELRELARLAN